MFASINDCHNVKDFRKLAKKKLPGPIFHYIDGGSDDEVTYRRNTTSFDFPRSEFWPTSGPGKKHRETSQLTIST